MSTERGNRLVLSEGGGKGGLGNGGHLWKRDLSIESRRSPYGEVSTGESEKARIINA